MVRWIDRLQLRQNEALPLGVAPKTGTSPPFVENQKSAKGKPPGRPHGSRNALSEAVICAFLRDFREHGQRAIAKVRETQPAAYLKLAVLLVPRERKVEQMNVIAGLSDERLEAMIKDIQDRLDRRAAGSDAKLIEGTVEPTAVETIVPTIELEPTKRKRRNRLLQQADTAIGPRERPKKRKAPLPPLS